MYTFTRDVATNISALVPLFTMCAWRALAVLRLPVLMQWCNRGTYIADCTVWASFSMLIASWASRGRGGLSDLPFSSPWVLLWEELPWEYAIVKIRW
jgi:hypothetical protein